MRTKKTIAVAAAVGLLLALAVASLWILEPFDTRNASRGGLGLAGACPACNILLITVETMRADHLRCYGYGRDVAPRICAFGESSLLFENAYTPAPATIPALRAIMSGDLISNEDLSEIISHHDGAVSLPRELSDRGYLTAGITDHRGLGDLMGQRPKSSVIIRDFDQFENLGAGRTGKTSAAAAEAVKLWLRKNRGERFFLWTHLFDPHFNWVPGEKAMSSFGFDEQACGRIRRGLDIEEIRKMEKSLSSTEVGCLEALYHAEVFETDALVGGILDELDRLGLADSTLVVITGDHGEEFRERDRIGHEWTVYNELIHVPLMIRNPHTSCTGRSVPPVSSLSIRDYLLAAVDGSDYADTGPVVSRAFHYYGSNTQNPREFRTRPNEFAIIRGDNKIICTPQEDRWELFHLDEDPGEQKNLWSPEMKDHPLASELRAWIEKNRVSPGAPTEESLQSYMELVERLKALGYTR